ncbi:MAG TPA: purine phosphorylase [Thermodesulfobacteriota bacterium]|nr:purine phosphorylase [Thermodesulfobacteriota bacterium]
MVTGIVAALLPEARILSSDKFSGGQLVCLRPDVLVIISGIGAERARAAALRLIEKGAHALLSWGCAGGLAPHLLPGSVVIPEKIFGSDGSVYSCDESWTRRVCGKLQPSITVVRGALAETPLVLASRREKMNLGKRGAVAVDMESASIARAAKEAGVPFIAIRAISDAVDADLPGCLAESVNEFGRVRPLALLKATASRPADIPKLIRTARNFGRAKAALSAVSARLAFNFQGSEL